MNFAVIILAIIVVVLIYVLYQLYADKGSLAEKVDLKKDRPVFAYTTLPTPNATRYSYGVWIFVNSWSSMGEKNIYSRYGSDGKPDIRLYLDTNAPTLKFDIRKEGVNVPETITITDNFPIQKWVYVITSIDNQIADMYVDGKLVISKKFDKMPVVSTAEIKLGGAEPLDIFLSKFTRFTTPMDPQTALSKYSSGNGITSSMPNYGMKLTILKDNVDNKQIRFF
jgi:hypothetical protein